MENEEQQEQDLWASLPHQSGEDRAEILIELAARAIQRSKGSEALALTQEAYSVYKSMGARASSVELSNAITGISLSLKELNQVDEAICTISDAIEIQRLNGHPSIVDTLRTKAKWLFQAGDYQAAITTLLEVVQINEIEGESAFVGRDLYIMAHCFGKLQNWIESIHHSEAARLNLVKAKLFDEVAWADVQIADSYAELGNAEIAADIAQRSLNYAELRNIIALKYSSLLTLGKVKTLLAEFELAEQYLLAAAELVQQSYDWETIEQIQLELLNLYSVQGRVELATGVQQQLDALHKMMEKAS